MKKLVLSLAAVLALAGCGSERPPGDDPPNTDPRQGRVTMYWSDPGWGSSPTWDWKVCTGTTLIVHIDRSWVGDRYIDNSPECLSAVPAASPASVKRPIHVASRAADRALPVVKVPGSRWTAQPTGRGIAKSLRFHQGWWGRFPAKVERAAFCVIRHESWGKMWLGQNPRSSASGAAQWIDSTWRVNAKRAGVKVTRKARYAPPKDQAKVFAWMWLNGGKKAWRGTHCPGTD